MLFWHVGGTVWIFRYVFKDPAVDLRALALGAIFPDLVDKPLSLLITPEPATTRLYAHALTFAMVGLAVAVLGTNRGTAWRKRSVAFAVGLLVHLLLDAMWTAPETLFWPVFGFEFAASGAPTVGQWLVEPFTDPIAAVLEALGLAYLIYLWHRAGLRDPERRRSLLRTGQIITE